MKLRDAEARVLEKLYECYEAGTGAIDVEDPCDWLPDVPPAQIEVAITSLAAKRLLTFIPIMEGGFAALELLPDGVHVVEGSTQGDAGPAVHVHGASFVQIGDRNRQQVGRRIRRANAPAEERAGQLPPDSNVIVPAPLAAAGSRLVIGLRADGPASVFLIDPGELDEGGELDLDDLDEIALIAERGYERVSTAYDVEDEPLAGHVVIVNETSEPISFSIEMRVEGGDA